MSEEIRCINLGYVVPKENAEEVEGIFKKHASWMEKFYSEDNDGQKHLLNSYLLKYLNLLIQLILQKVKLEI